MNCTRFALPNQRGKEPGMNSLIEPVAVESPLTTRRWQTADKVSAIILPGLVWLTLFSHLRVDWAVNPQYNYGWVVPLLGLGFMWRRWASRPAPGTVGQTAAIGLIAGFLLLLLLPIRLIEEANPEWRFILWMHAIQ